MERAAENLQFELAAIYRDRLASARRIAEQQKIVSTAMADADYVALAQDPRSGDTAVQVFLVRHGRLVGREGFMLEGAENYSVQDGSSARQDGAAAGVSGADGGASAGAANTGSAGEQIGAIVGAFLQQFYDQAAYIPSLILVQAAPPARSVVEEWLADRRGTRVEVRVPRRGDKVKLLELAQENAAEYLRLRQAERAADTNRQTEALAELQAALQLERAPTRIECFDISTLQGTNTVGAMVVFNKGAPAKNFYKRFKLHGKGSQGAPDDFASMREMLLRRFRRLVEPEADGDEPAVDPGQKGRSGAETWRLTPDLVIIDGGKGQLGVAVEVLQELGLVERIPVVGLAKREEEVFRPGLPDPLWLKRGSPALHLVQRIRDEAHRFGVTYHRTLRSKEQTRSSLDDIAGIGPRRRKAILTHFAGDLERVRAATVEELMAVPGMNRRLAATIKEQL
jgi:excinuclease ABC subunit C